MIKDTITYRNKAILTLYHQGFPDDHLTLKRFRKEYIGKNRIVFLEEYVPEDEWNNLSGYVWEECGLLAPHEKHNPYHEETCANMVHRIYLNKPSVIWKKDGTTIDEKELVTILAFIQKYTGMNLEGYPVFIGDIFLFSPSELRYHSNKVNSVILYNLKSGMQIILRLKNRNVILQSKIIDIAEDTEKLEITTECNWNNHDIEIYKNDRLIYINTNVHYMRDIRSTLITSEGAKRIPLTTLQEYYEIESQNGIQESIMGTPPEPIQECLDEMNRMLVHKINNQKASNRFLFVEPNELSVAMKKITETMFHATDEIWLIDSYFTDKNHGLGKMTDWLRLLISTVARRKIIVFSCKNEDNALNLVQLRHHIEEDIYMQDVIASNQLCSMQLIQTKKPIHDRFLIIRNGDDYLGISIGTSFNSLDSNHYCIQNLAHKEAQTVLESLVMWMKDGNVEAQEKIPYDNR